MRLSALERLAQHGLAACGQVRRLCLSFGAARSGVCAFLLIASVLSAQSGWYPHEGGLLKYRVQIRFGEEPDTMPDGWKFGRVSAVATDSQGLVYVFQRGPKADPIVVF